MLSYKMYEDCDHLLALINTCVDVTGVSHQRASESQENNYIIKGATLNGKLAKFRCWGIGTIGVKTYLNL